MNNETHETNGNQFCNIIFLLNLPAKSIFFFNYHWTKLLNVQGRFEGENLPLKNHKIKSEILNGCVTESFKAANEKFTSASKALSYQEVSYPIVLRLESQSISRYEATNWLPFLSYFAKDNVLTLFFTKLLN